MASMRRERANSDSLCSSSSDSSSESKRHTGHREGYYPELVETYSFLVPVKDRDNEGKVIGVLCSLCRKHKADQRNHAATWTSRPCSCIRKDIMERHSKSAMNRVKTDLRNRLNTQNLDHLMRISINGPCLDDYNFNKTATSWGNQRQKL